MTILKISFWQYSYYCNKIIGKNREIREKISGYIQQL
jgi:hypothetical protein